jgi:hypothetical protein
MADHSFESASFADIAVALFETASIHASDVEECELLAAALNADGAQPPHPGVNSALAALQHRALLLGAAQAWFKALIPHEQTIRAIAASAVSRPAA